MLNSHATTAAAIDTPKPTSTAVPWLHVIEAGAPSWVVTAWATPSSGGAADALTTRAPTVGMEMTSSPVNVEAAAGSERAAETSLTTAVEADASATVMVTLTMTLAGRTLTCAV